MAKNNMKPRIRFKGFTDAWEQRKLGEYFIERNERSGEGELISVTINAGIKKFNELGRFDTKPEDLSKYKRVEVGDIAYNSMRMWQGASGYSSYSGILSPAYTVISPKTGVSSLFFAYLIKRPQMIHLFEINSQGLTSDTWNLKFPAFSKIEASAPSDIDEQENISELFTVLDNLITLHQRKYEKFVNIKKALLEKMFPQGDEKVPRIRFKGFTDAWEQRKLGEISEKTVEKNRERRYSETFTNSAEFGIVSQMEYFDHAISKIESIGGYYVVHPDDFVYNPRISVSAPVGPINRNKLQKIGIMSPLYTVFRAHDIHPQYLEYYFKSDVWHAYMRFNGDSGARSDRFSIKTALFFDMPIPCPSVGEQEKIGKILARVDNLITLHQRQVEKLKNIKSALLEKMFV